MAKVDAEVEDVATSTRTRRWSTARILSALPLRLSSKWMHLLESEMKHDITEPSQKSLTLDWHAHQWGRTWEAAACQQEDRSEAAAVLAMAGGVAGDEKEWRHLLLCSFMALLPSLRNLHRLTLYVLPGDSVEEKEEALEVFYQALLSHQSTASLGHLQLYFDEAYGTHKSCGHLAHLLRSAHCKLHTLEFTYVDLDGIVHIARGLSSQKTSLTKLAISHCSRVGDARVQLLAAMLCTNCTLRELQLSHIGMTADGVGRLCDALSPSKVPASSSLDTLDISFNESIGAQGALHLGNMLAGNLPGLRKLDVSMCGLEDEEGQVAKGLQGNTGLEELNISDNNLGERGLKLLFRCLASNVSMKKLNISGERKSKQMPAAEELAAMVSSNASLLHLDISEVQAYSPEDWATHILPAVAQNRVLQSLNLAKCKGVDGNEVQTALLELLRVNTTIQHIQLDDTPLHKSGGAAAVEEELRLNREFRHTLSAMPTSKPRSCRIVLCGTEYAGKSTLLRTLKRLQRLPLYQRMQVWGHRVWRFLFGQSAHSKELSRRTRGIDTHLLKDEQNLRVSVWDFAGHREFHALHEFIFPNANDGATLFVFTYSPIVSPLSKDRAGKVKEHQQLEGDLRYWLKFIASHSKRRAAKPLVLVVITNRDRLAAQLRDAQRMDVWVSGAQAIINMLAKEFHDLVSVRPQPFVLNALATNDPQLTTWVTEMEDSLRHTLLGLQQVPAICDLVAKAATGFPQHTPIVSTHEFAAICDSQAQERKWQFEPGSWRAVAAYLHSAGEVIYHDQLNFIVRDPGWFGQNILGRLIDLFLLHPSKARGLIRKLFKCVYDDTKQAVPPGDYLPKNGYMSREDLSLLLRVALGSFPGLNAQHLDPEDLIQLMLLLNLCYKQNPDDPDTGYLLPATFDDEGFRAANGKRRLKWRNWNCPRGEKFEYTGRRLECADQQRTFLTDGFFPRLQVVLHNHACAEKWVIYTDTDTCVLEKNLFSIFINGMEILVEFSGLSGYFVDILVKSSKAFEQTKEFVDLNFISTIRSFCASQEGCQGVSLREAIVRTACLTAANSSPMLCAHRKEQAIPIEELQQKMARTPNYQHTWGPVKDMDDGGRELLPAAVDDPSLLLHGELPRPLPAAPAIADDLTWPSHIFLTLQERKFAAKTRVGRVVAFQLHFMCESSHGEHPVDQQPGRSFYVVDKGFGMEQNVRKGLQESVAAVLQLGGSVVPGLGGAGGLVQS